jgi:uncharacterized protein YijF (DUF1287 family)
MIEYLGKLTADAWSAVTASAVLLALVASTWAEEAPSKLQQVLRNAHDQVGVTIHYDPSYQTIPFPNGDVPLERGVCTDVIVRAYRSVGIDLQLLVNQDMRQAFHAYPRTWGLSRPDPNIDHRRVQNLATFFTRQKAQLPVSTDARDYAPGDIVTWRLPTGQAHIGLVSDQQHDGRPLIVHNIGSGARLEDILFVYQITGHYRFSPDRS